MLFTDFSSCGTVIHKFQFMCRCYNHVFSFDKVCREFFTCSQLPNVFKYLLRFCWALDKISSDADRFVSPAHKLLSLFSKILSKSLIYIENNKGLKKDS